MNDPLRQSTDNSASDRVRMTLSTIRELDEKVHAFIEFAPDKALASAEGLDNTVGSARGSLHGIPVAIKEIVDVEGLRCPWGAVAHKNRVAENDAAVVKRLKTAGAVVVGTVVSTEYAIAAAGATRNPIDVSRTPGGSSSGPAASVAAGMVPLSVGTQTIGSIVRPALYCGALGFKPTFGIISLEGVMALSTPLDHIGFFAESVELIEEALRVSVDDSDELEDGSSPKPGVCWFMAQSSSAQLSDPAKAAMAEAQQILAREGYEIGTSKELDALRPEAEVLAQDLVAIGLAENHGHDMDAFPDDVSAVAMRLIQKGREFSKTQIEERVARVDEMRMAVDGLIGLHDTILSDAVEGFAPAWAKDHTGPNTLQAVWSVLGLPTASWPLSKQIGASLPIGVQLSAARYQDFALLKRLKSLLSAS